MGYADSDLLSHSPMSNNSSESPSYFTDWQNKKDAIHGSKKQTKDMIAGGPTMEKNNRTVIGDGKGSGSPPDGSVVYNNMGLYDRLRCHNKDNWSIYREDVDISKSVIREIKEHILYALASQIGLNSSQKKRAHGQFMKLDIRRGTYNTSVNAFIICALVSNEDAQDRGCDKLYHPQRPSEKNDREFQRLQNTLIRNYARIDEAALTKLYNKHTQGKLST